MKLSKLKSMDSRTKERRRRVIEARKAQLLSGVKPNKLATTKDKKEGREYIPLTDGDIKRIEKEIEVLETRI